MDEFSVIPKVGAFLRSEAACTWTVHGALCELIDNSMDAGAQRIDVFNHGFGEPLIVSDNGNGKKDLSVFVQPGAHDRTSETRSGVWGRGGKKAALFLGQMDSTYGVDSVCEGRRYTLANEWRVMEELNEWTVRFSKEGRPSTLPSGTRVSISPMSKQPRWRTLRDQLAFTYFPALRAGREIVLDVSGSKGPVLPWTPPPIVDDVSCELVVNGRRATLRAGIIAEGYPGTSLGTVLVHGIRVLRAKTSIGYGDMSSTRVFSVVEIHGDEWTRGTTKDGIDDLQFDELSLAVEPLLRPLLEKAMKAESQFVTNSMLVDVAAKVNASLDAKAKRRSPSKGDGTHSRGTGDRKHRDAKKKQDGHTMRHARPCSIRVAVDHLGDEEGIGTVSANNHITLNLDEPSVRLVTRESPDARAVMFLVAGLYAKHIVAHRSSPNIRLPFLNDEEAADETKLYSRLVAGMLSPDAEFDGQRLIEAAE